MNGLVRRGENPGLNCANESMDHFTFCFVKEQKVKTNEEYIQGTSEHQVSGKNKLRKCEKSKAVIQRQVTRPWQTFKRSRISGKERVGVGTDTSKAVEFS